MVVSDDDQSEETKKRRTLAKIQYMATVQELMPAGQPDYLGMVRFPKITDLVQQEGHAVIHLILSVMLRDFCATMNVVRNMNDDQIVEAAAMMLDECGTFRLEDYAQFFALAKRGKLGQIRDRIDLQTISDMLDEYFNRRRDAAIDLQEREIERQEAQLPVKRVPADPMDDKFMSVGGALSGMRAALADKIGRPNGKEAK